MEINRLPEQAVMAKAKKQLLYWGMASMTIFFAAFCSYYLVIHASGNWFVFNLPALFYVSTALIIVSSGTMYWAQQSALKNNTGAIRTAVLITFLLGLAFCASQFFAWKTLYANGIVFSGRTSNLSGSILYVITFMHFLHIVAGLIALLVTWINVLRNKYTQQNHLGLSLCGIFWHFLDILWIILFLFLYLFR
ncbi:MAG: cytochrome c oxidase subunit 3 [Bacteroidia bacterium]